MERSLPPDEPLVEEDYIDMDISTATFLCCTMSAPPGPAEFEFQMGSKSVEAQPLTSPADELFYRGKLLPLYLPPRLQMVEKILQGAAINSHVEHGVDEFGRSIVVTTPQYSAMSLTSPFDSCNTSPTTSCVVSGELMAEGCVKECTMGELVQPNPKKSWSKKLKLIKQSAIGLKLKASKAYLKSFFTKSGCSNAKGEASKAEGCSDAPEPKQEKKHVKNADGEMHSEGDLGHRKSFSCALKRQTSTKSSVSSSSFSSNSSSFSSANSNDQLCVQTATLRRSSSVNSDNESSIQGAIAYCKRSHQQASAARKSVSDVGLCLMSASRVAPDSEKDDYRTRLCRR